MYVYCKYNIIGVLQNLIMNKRRRETYPNTCVRMDVWKIECTKYMWSFVVRLCQKYFSSRCSTRRNLCTNYLLNFKNRIQNRNVIFSIYRFILKLPTYVCMCPLSILVIRTAHKWEPEVGFHRSDGIRSRLPPSEHLLSAFFQEYLKDVFKIYYALSHLLNSAQFFKFFITLFCLILRV